jgi:glycosyltransferase involved in cell wall biosynthesis
MKVAIVHDVLFEYGGAERVLDAFLKVYPQADVFTFFYNQKQPMLEKYRSYIKGTSFVTAVPSIEKLGSLFSVTKLFSWLYFWFLDLSDYDLVISSTHSYGAKGVRASKKSLHVSYIHTSPRYLYGEVHELQWIRNFPLNIIFTPILKILKLLDVWATHRPDVLLANSKNTQKKIKTIYGLDSRVVYPPVFIEKVSKASIKRYFITQGRLVRQKGFELVVATCTSLRLPLLVIGTGYYKKNLERIAGKSVKFLGSVPDSMLNKLYAYAHALLYAAHSDDLGLVPIESLARGVPVIGYYTGGAKESLIDGKNSVVFTEFTQESLKKAISKFSKRKFSAHECQHSVEKFKYTHFKKQILKIVRQYES